MFRSRPRERNDHTAYVRSRERTCGRTCERTCGRFVPGTKLPSDFRALERTEWRERVTICNKLKMIFADRKRLQHLLFLRIFLSF